MNFLAHIYLSAQDEDEMVGNFMGDFVKGRDFATYPEAISRGIRLHRQIDTFTDQHPVFRQSTALLRPYSGKYAGVLADVYYDHFLAANWESFYNLPLLDFSLHFYQNMERNYQYLPERVKGFFPNMRSNNWLVHYGEMWGIERSLQGIDNRTNGKSKLGEGATWLRDHYEELKAHFMLFMPEVRSFVEETRENL
ncbi:ACP phosphodiesterase [Limibacter armeniacum]|uniref:acyl carrier protein phosphodiesterase n=1 Tax=Limibacter armeniacum TaxID=466084 RepID=UPI002FE5C67F